MRDENSRNQLTDVVSVVTATGRLAKPEFVNLRTRVTGHSPDDRTVLVDGSMSWASIARKELTDGRFWWAIADVSNVVDPFAELQVTQQLLVPSVHRLLFDILATENQR